MDYSLIQKQFEEVIAYSQRDILISPITYDASDLFQQWKYNKMNIRKYLPFFPNNELIYEYPHKVSFGLNECAKQERFDRFIREIWEFRHLQDFLRDIQQAFR